MKTKMMLAVGLVALLTVVSGYGQQQYSVKAKIDFPFKVGDKVLPAGDYEFVRDTQAMVFRIQGQGQEAKEGAFVPILTRLASEFHPKGQDRHLAFDVVGGAYILSEIWIPTEDGYLVQATKGAHTHKVVNAKY
jgi:hypothetical protein